MIVFNRMVDRLKDEKLQSIDLDDARKYIVRVVEEAGGILRQHFNLRTFLEEEKGPTDLVTTADSEVDEFIRKNILEEYPVSELLTEETPSGDYPSFRETENLWIVDPLDGTVNFSRRDPNFAVSVALVDKGVSKLGVVHVPMSGKTYWAQADQEMAVLNGDPIEVSTTGDLSKVSFVCDWVPDDEASRRKMIHWLDNIVPHVRQIKSMGSAVADLASLAEDIIDVYINPGLKPWDLAASSLIVQKAGGMITTPEGEEWDVFNPNCLVTNGLLHKQVLDLLN